MLLNTVVLLYNAQNCRVSLLDTALCKTRYGESMTAMTSSFYFWLLFPGPLRKRARKRLRCTYCISTAPKCGCLPNAGVKSSASSLANILIDGAMFGEKC